MLGNGETRAACAGLESFRLDRLLDQAHSTNTAAFSDRLTICPDTHCRIAVTESCCPNRYSTGWRLRATLVLGIDRVQFQSVVIGLVILHVDLLNANTSELGNSMQCVLLTTALQCVLTRESIIEYDYMYDLSLAHYCCLHL